MTAPDVDLLAEEYAEQYPADADNDAATLARAYLRVRGGSAEELVRRWQFGGWSEVDWSRPEGIAALGYGQRVTDWLRAALAPDAAPSPGVEGEAARIEDLIERSSLGTPEAKALRATVSDERAARIVALAACMADAPNPTHSWTPEDPCACGSPDTCPATPAAPTDEGARLVPHPTPGKAWVKVPHRNDISNDWIEVNLPARLGEGLSEEERVAPQGEEFVRGIVWAAYEGGMWCGECDPADQDDDCCVLPQRIRKRILADRARGLGGDRG